MPKISKGMVWHCYPFYWTVVEAVMRSIQIQGYETLKKGFNVFFKNNFWWKILVNIGIDTKLRKNYTVHILQIWHYQLTTSKENTMDWACEQWGFNENGNKKDPYIKNQKETHEERGFREFDTHKRDREMISNLLNRLV